MTVLINNVVKKKNFVKQIMRYIFGRVIFLIATLDQISLLEEGSIF